jgi:hypothetical protein
MKERCRVDGVTAATDRTWGRLCCQTAALLAVSANPTKTVSAGMGSYGHRHMATACMTSPPGPAAPAARAGVLQQALHICVHPAQGQPL